MRLTLSLLRRKMPNGNIWLGKHRLGHNIYPVNIERMVKRLQIEERNLLLLRHPYLTVEQEKGHEEALGKPQKELAKLKWEGQASRMLPSVRVEKYFKHLAHNVDWDL